jgi:hypothetical protein
MSKLEIAEKVIWLIASVFFLIGAVVNVINIFKHR